VIGALAATLAEARPDFVVVSSDDQMSGSSRTTCRVRHLLGLQGPRVSRRAEDVFPELRGARPLQDSDF
jgi:hypothetical protein